MSSIYSIPTWTEENRNLHDAICQARVSKDSADSLKQLLQINKEKFLNLLDNVPKDSAHRKNLNSNKAYINRTSHNVSKDFVAKTLFISDQLNINEYVAATLLMYGTTESSRVNSNSIDTAVLLYHGERGFLLACLDVILKTAKDASISEQIRSVCYEFTQELLNERIQTTTFVAKLLNTLNDLSKTISSIIGTGTVIGQLPVAGSGKLGEDISNLRIERLSDERVYIVQILYHIISLFNINTNEKLKVLELLEEAELSDSATSYMIIAMISALSNENQPEESTPSSSTMDFINRFHNRIMTHGSKAPAIKAIVVLQWILYLSEPSRVNTVIGNSFSRRTEADIQELLDHCFNADVFRFMNDYLLYFQQPNAMIDTDRQTIKQDATNTKDSKVIDAANHHIFNADIRNDFQSFVIYELEKLALSVISILFSTLQKLKYKEEDTNTPVQAPLSTDNALLSSSNNTNQCYDLQYFLTFLASVFRHRVNAGEIFWKREHGGLHHFIRWLLDVKVIGTISAAFDFLGSIATGDTSAGYMFHFLKIGMEANLAASAMFSWGKLFAALQFYVDQYRNAPEESYAVIPAVEEELLHKFLIILKQCVQYSQEARIYFWSDQTINCQVNLVNLLNCPTSTNLRAVICDVLSAFCSSWGGGINNVGRFISLSVWKILEDCDMFIANRKAVQDKSQMSYHSPGLLQELEDEKRSQIYTETLSIIRLIGSAIHTQSKTEALHSGFQDAESSIPADLGKNSKNPGATPFISLVIDEIFTSLASLSYKYPEARWELTEACLMVMENSLESFSVKYFETQDKRNISESDLLKCLIHPGFQVIIRILSGGRVIDELFSVIDTCAKKETKEVENMPYHKKCLVRSLRILNRVLNLQHTVCKVIIPFFSDSSKKKASSEFQLEEYTFSPLPSVVPLGQLILFHTNVLNQIALLVNYEDQEEVCFLCTKILEKLSSESKSTGSVGNQTLSRSTVTTSFSYLGSSIVNVLKSSQFANSIIFGVSERLSIDIPEVTTYDDYEYDPNNIPFWLADETLNNTFNYPLDFKPRISSSVRIALLDLLLKNIANKSTSTLTEFLLGYGPLNQIEDSTSNQSSLICFHAILAMLQKGLAKSSLEDAMIEDNMEPTLPLIDTHPILAEKCYELIYRLCSKKTLSISTLRYLRNQEDFLYKQFNELSARIEHNIQVESTPFGGLITCADGSQYKTDFFKLRSKLHQRAWLLHLIALELHTTASLRQKNEANKLLKLLYGHKKPLSDEIMDTSDDSHGSGLFSKFQSYQQPLVKMIELVSSLEFSWSDYLLENVKLTELKYYKGFDVSHFFIINERECQVYNVREIYKTLMEHQKTMVNDENKSEINTEMEYILSWVIAQNHTKEIAYGKLQCLKAWKEVVHITLVECTDLIHQEFRESIIYELLTMILPKITQAKDYDGNMLKSMSEIVLTLVDQLRLDKSNRPTSQLPVEKLKSIFSGIINCIRQKETTLPIRGDLYSSISSFLLYVKTHSRDSTSTQLEQFIIDVISANNSQLLQTICDDAFNELDIWKTTAYIVLDALNTLALRAKSNVVQSALIQRNFLQCTIDFSREDAALTNLLEQIDAPLLPLYIFEAKMSIFLRFAMNPAGAELLFSNQIFEVLGKCQFMKAQVLDSTTTEMNIDASKELAERYQQLIMPTLKLIVALLCCYNGNNDVVLLKTEGWARKQQSALVNILQYNRRPITIASLEQLKLITTILYFISCRSGFFNDFINRGINQLHNAILQLEVPDSLANRVEPTTVEEIRLDKTPDAAGSTSSMLQLKASKIIKIVNSNLTMYKSKK